MIDATRPNTPNTKEFRMIGGPYDGETIKLEIKVKRVTTSCSIPNKDHVYLKDREDDDFFSYKGIKEREASQ
jgi:hypothetical protein